MISYQELFHHQLVLNPRTVGSITVNEGKQMKAYNQLPGFLGTCKTLPNYSYI